LACLSGVDPGGDLPRCSRISSTEEKTSIAGKVVVFREAFTTGRKREAKSVDDVLYFPKEFKTHLTREVKAVFPPF
jgi:hypothetical protein